MDLRLPEHGTNNIWYRYQGDRLVIIFVHGVLSDSRSCWLNEKGSEGAPVYWPELAVLDHRLGRPSIFLGGYHTAVDAGAYEIANCASELHDALGRPDISRRPPLLEHSAILFVCHSTGGIVVRYLLEKHYEQFKDKRVGLLLIASPSYGSTYADRLSWLASFYKNRLGQQLKWGSWSLEDLDRRFKDLVNDGRIPGLRGVEAYENHFVIRRKWLRPITHVVDEQSAGRYFGAARLLRNTDHFSAVKPDSISHPAHELLVDFVTKEFPVLADRSPVGQSRRTSEVLNGERDLKRTPRLNRVADVDEDAVGETELRQRNYEVSEVMYRGHYSIVRRCVKRKTGEACVVKQTLESLVSIPALEALQNLSCRNIVTPRGMWTKEGFVFEELPFINGCRLDHSVARDIGGLRGAVLVSFHSQLMRILERLHVAGLIYRDVHPENIFMVVQPMASNPASHDVRGEEWDECDTFGPGKLEGGPDGGFTLAWVLADSSFVALADEVSSRPPLIHGSVTPYEQAIGRPVFASDMYALGATVYFGITGHNLPEGLEEGELPDDFPFDFSSHRHRSGKFGAHLAALLSPRADVRPLSSSAPLSPSSTVGGYCGALRVGPNSFIVSDTGRLDTRLVDAETLYSLFQDTERLGGVTATEVEHWLAVARASGQNH